DEPGIVDPAATVSVPPMVAVTVPIAMPIGRMPREDMLVRAGAGEAAGICATAGIAALDCSKTSIVTEAVFAVGVNCSKIVVVSESGETIGPTRAIQSAFSIIERTKTLVILNRS